MRIAGSPKKISPPGLEHQQAAQDRGRAGLGDSAVLAFELAAWSATVQHRAQVFQGRAAAALVIGHAERDLHHAFLGLVEFSRLRTGSAPSPMLWCAPGVPFRRTSQNTVGRLEGVALDTDVLQPLVDLRCGLPAPARPERSPFTSAVNTGTRARKDSARTCSVTVLPVPVAPVIRPWRLAMPAFSKDLFAARSTQQDVVFGHVVVPVFAPGTLT